MNQEFGDRLFSNIDASTQKILIEPHGPDPVIYGIRGETPRDVITAAELIQSGQDKERWMVFRTNQGTGAHLVHRVRLSDIRPYMAAVVEGEVTTESKIIEGGHVIFKITDGSTNAECAVYEPTGEFREIATMLTVGDKVSLDVGVRPASRMHSLTLNVEGLRILQLTDKVNLVNPICPHCLRRMKSAGKEKGFKCIKCGFKDPQAKKTEIPVERQLKAGRYMPPPRAQRHLTRPNGRMNRRNKGIPNNLVEEWHNP
jgi:tRNA(Ile2)-agmatinylcytidine synthase